MLKQFIGLCFLCLVVFSCDISNITNKELIGKWDNTYELKTKETDGNWGEWHTINTFAALPQLEFTKSGKILWDGKLSEACCQFQKYEVSGTKISLSQNAKSDQGCELVNCLMCATWEIEKLTDKELELKICEQNMVRYSRAKD